MDIEGNENHPLRGINILDSVVAGFAFALGGYLFGRTIDMFTGGGSLEDQYADDVDDYGEGDP